MDYEEDFRTPEEEYLFNKKKCAERLLNAGPIDFWNLLMENKENEFLQQVGGYDKFIKNILLLYRENPSYLLNEEIDCADFKSHSNGEKKCLMCENSCKHKPDKAICKLCSGRHNNLFCQDCRIVFFWFIKSLHSTKCVVKKSKMKYHRIRSLNFQLITYT